MVENIRGRRRRFGMRIGALILVLANGVFGLTIAENGISRSTVVVAAEAPESDQHAARELAGFLSQVTGGAFPVANQRNADQPNLLVGVAAGRWIDPALSVSDLGSDGIVIKTVMGNLILAGGSPRGALYAVYTFLEDHVGCRWWSSTESSIPQRPTLAVGDLNLRYAPPFECRETDYYDALDGDYAVRNRLNGHQHRLDAARGGRKWQRAVSTDKWSVHTFFDFIAPDQYFSPHPEWFSLINGVRTVELHNSSLCLTNEAMRQEFGVNLKRMLRDNPDYTAHTGLSEVRFYLQNSSDFVGNPGPGNGWGTSSKVTVTASSQHPTYPAIRGVDGSGLDPATGLLHGIVPADSMMSGHKDASAPYIPYPGCVTGRHWVAFQFDQVYALGPMWIWNLNVNPWHIQGMKNVTIQFSTTGGGNPGEWQTLYAGVIPEAIGLGMHGPDFKIDFSGRSVRYVVITVHDTWADPGGATLAAVSQPDGLGYCQCSNCLAVAGQEGSYAGLILRFVNAVTADVRTEFPQMTVDTLAYHYSRTPPQITRPTDDVIVRLVAAYETPDRELSYAKPLDDPRNQEFHDDLTGWAQICNRLYCWYYLPNFGSELLPFPNLRVLGDNVRFFAEHNVKGLFGEGWVTPGTELAELRAWVWAKLLWNPNQDVQSLIAQFVDGYYGSAGPSILAYLNCLEEAVEVSGEWLGQGTGPTARCLSFETLDYAWAHLRSAESAVVNDPERRDRVRVAQMPLRYAFLSNWNALRDEARSVGAVWPMTPRPQETYAALVQAGTGKYVNFKVPPLPSIGAIRFGEYPITVYSAASQGNGGTATVEEDGFTLHLRGNAWRKVAIPFEIAVNTILEFDFKAPMQGEIHAIGFDNDDVAGGEKMFRLYGTELWGLSSFADYAAVAPGWKHYRIPVGQFYTGSMGYLVFANDHDVAVPAAEGFFSNVRVYRQWDSTVGPVTVKTSSSHPDLPGIRVIDHSGITADGLRHNGVYGTMWMSAVLADSVGNPRGGTVAGGHWIEFKFDQIYRVGNMRIWNYNEPAWRIQGAKNVTVQYSRTGGIDPADWTTVYQGQVAMADGSAPTGETPVSLIVNFGNVEARYVMITAEAGPGMNWSSGVSDRVGLSEVKFELEASPRTLRGQIILGDYSGDVRDVGLRVELIRDGQVARTARMLLDGDGRFVVPDVEQGIYDVSVKSCAWLRKVLPNMQVGAADPVELGVITLAGGDNDGDNEITTSDLATILLNMDSIGE